MITEDQVLKSATHRHYKGGLYQWIAEVKNSETGELMVVYEHVWPHEQRLWVRPATLFYGQVAPSGCEPMPRFAPIAAFPSGSTVDPSQQLAIAIDKVKQQGHDTDAGVAALISATALVSLHHRMCLDRITQLEKQQQHLCPECKGGGKVNVKVETGLELVQCPVCHGVGILKGTGVH